MQPSDNPTVAFREEQQFRQPWVWLLIVGVALATTSVFGPAMVQQLVRGQPWGDRPMSDAALAVLGTLVLLLAGGLLLLFYWMKLVVEVRDTGAVICFRPLLRREIPFREIRHCEARTYRPIREYGGWGVRFGWKGVAYNVSGNRGVQLVLANGKRVLIGSQHAEELAAAIRARLGGTPA